MANAAVRSLLVTRNGYKKSFVDANLRGANLDGVNLNEANLKQADLSGATLRQADLRNANLAETLAIEADLTGAALTGACLQAWNIDHTTTLENIDCQFVFLLEQANEWGDRERRPHDPNKVFQPGDFEKLYREVINTVQLLLKNGCNPEAFAAAFQAIMQEHPGVTPDLIQGFEKKGEDVLVTVAVPPETNKGKFEQEFDEIYQARLEAQTNAALLDAEKRHSEKVEGLAIAVVNNLGHLLSNLTINASSNATAEGKAMQNSSDQSQNINVGRDFNISNSVVSLREISGNVSNTINQLQTTNRPEAAELADLLKQLQTAIEAEPDLKTDDKTEALEQVGTIAKAGQNPQDGTLKKLAGTAVKVLRGTIATLPDTAKLVEATSKLLPAIISLLAL